MKLKLNDGELRVLKIVLDNYNERDFKDFSDTFIYDNLCEKVGKMLNGK